MDREIVFLGNPFFSTRGGLLLHICLCICTVLGISAILVTTLWTLIEYSLPLVC